MLNPCADVQEALASLLSCHLLPETVESGNSSKQSKTSKGPPVLSFNKKFPSEAAFPSAFFNFPNRHSLCFTPVLVRTGNLSALSCPCDDWQPVCTELVYLFPIAKPPSFFLLAVQQRSHAASSASVNLANLIRICNLGASSTNFSALH